VGAKSTLKGGSETGKFDRKPSSNAGEGGENREIRGKAQNNKGAGSGFKPKGEKNVSKERG